MFPRYSQGIIRVFPRHGLLMPREEIAFSATPRIQSQFQVFWYGRSIFCLPHRPNFSDIFDSCLHWVSVVRVPRYSQGIPKVFPRYSQSIPKVFPNNFQLHSHKNREVQIQYEICKSKRIGQICHYATDPLWPTDPQLTT